MEYVERHLQEYPAYCVLNLCRLLYSYRTRDVVISKTAAGNWAQETYPQWKELIHAARKTYQGQATAAYEQLMSREISGLYRFASQQIANSLAGEDRNSDS